MKYIFFLFFALCACELILAGEESRPSFPKKEACAFCENDILSELTATPWILKNNRVRCIQPSVEFEDQDGVKIASKELFNAPSVLTFVYTRCENPNKCPAVMAQIAKLASLVKENGFADKLNIFIITYDPDYDIPEVLKRYSKSYGLICNPHFRMLRTSNEKKDEFFKRINIAVNYDASKVNIHGIQLLLLDSSGKLAKSYHSLVWDNIKVLNDLKVLLTE